MNPTVKQLLAKKNLSGKDIGRLLIANLIDIYNGDSLPQDKIIELAQSVRTEKDQSDYYYYGRVFKALDVARDLCAEKMKQAHVACAGLRLFTDMVLYANMVVSSDECGPYRLGAMQQDIRDTATDLWLRLQSSVQAYFATKATFQAAGAWLKIPGLEMMLPDDGKLRLEVKDFDESCKKSMAYFEDKELPKGIIDDAREIFTPINYDERQIEEKEIAKAKKMFKLATFDFDIENAIEMLNPYGESDEQ